MSFPELIALTTTDLIRAMYADFSDEAHRVTGVVQKHCKSFLEKGLSPDNSTSMEDCLLLYLLIRRFERRFAFEIGTYVGTTSVCMNEAVRHNGGVLTTCDPIDYAALSPWSGIRFIRGNGSAALALLHDEGHRIDFAFIDWTPDEATMRRLNEMCTEDAVLAVHDYGPDLKGKTTVEMLENFYVHATAGRWFLPDAAPVTFSDGMRVNYCTAFFIPYHLLGSVKLGLTA